MLQQGNLLGVAQPAGLHGRVRDEEDGADANGDGQAAEDDEHDAPAGKARAGSDMLEAVGDGAAEDLAEAETEVPEGEARGLLRLGVPLGADEHQGGTDGGLEDTQEDAGDEKGLVVVGGGTAGGCGAPEDDVGAQPLGRWNHLEEVDCGDFVSLNVSLFPFCRLCSWFES